MKYEKTITKAIKVFGIHWMVIVTEDAGQFQTLDNKGYVHLMDYKRGELPSPGILRNALRKELIKLDTFPERVLAVTDCPSAIPALQKAGLAMVVGIRREGMSRKEMFELGVDYVAHSVEEINIVQGIGETFRFTQDLPGAFQFLKGGAYPLFQKNPVFFFDYDGTLAPIVNEPEKAYLKPSVRSLLNQLSDHYPVAIVSGRDLRDVREFVQLDHLIYAGSHGFRIAGPGGISWTHSEAEKTFPLLDRVEKHLKKQFSDHQGILVERKYSAIAIHYRNAPKNSFKKINQVADNIVRESPDLKKSRGKKIIEIKPSFDWNKGKAVEWILRKMGYADPQQYLPVYLGDDTTDEDAFRVLADHGTSILVGDHGRISAADMQLRDTGQVEEILHVLVQEGITAQQKSPTFS
jgi:trehalose-phosphatase